jgi:hypothetical protein
MIILDYQRFMKAKIKMGANKIKTTPHKGKQDFVFKALFFNGLRIFYSKRPLLSAKSPFLRENGRLAGLGWQGMRRQSEVPHPCGRNTGAGMPRVRLGFTYGNPIG